MKFSTLALAAVAQVASAHYFFDTNIVGGVQQPAFKYVRQSSRAVKYNPIKFSSNPAADIRDGSTVDGPDIVCNQGAFASAGKTEVLTVNAGEEVRLKLAVGAKFQHPGPGLVYMSKAPGSVKSYDGSGDWFKIYEEGVCDGGDFTSTAWCDYDRDWIAAKIPKDTPNGEYLVRMEHIGVHRSHVNQPEHYVSCLQVKVQSGGNGTPGPMVKFPGAYKATDPYANFSIYNGRKAFPMPGPAVWAGGANGGASSPQATTAAKEVATAPASKPTTLATVPVAAKPTAQAGCAALYGQCGGQGFSGAKCCASGACKAVNQWYSQCLN
ncbi:carbohydrate-binding module family 1 protein [Macroventuria anomochaeta]|uniref:Carbohydrate-binding module family 1 protein n=1 Tax=Macroventuria anomochaeta TaxID=301207 RepID=A0ACB6S3D7_9PLEO|nr:carbohydrate-binding module family 1 protein [Macroventuria anomochaeta]KAF2628487.1 carbohydrate-binding module family 1 protein [Macroventuria anomochaeta]